MPKKPHATIRLDSERVIIRLGRSSYTVDAVFDFYNRGETTTEWVGFPKGWYATNVSKEWPFEFVRFDAWIDGRRVKVTDEQESDRTAGMALFLNSASSSVKVPSASEASPRSEDLFTMVRRRYWLVHHVTFPRDTGTRIRTSYEARYSSYDGPGQAAVYVVGTGTVLGRRHRASCLHH